MTSLPITVVTASVTETEKVGYELGEYLLNNGKTDAFIAMYGDLGAGKTAFVRGLSEAVTPGAHVCSPTYTIVNEYYGGGRTLCHCDMYRIESDDDLYSIGFYDYENCVIAAEWCEKIPFALPEKYIKLTIKKLDGDSREITAEEVESI